MALQKQIHEFPFTQGVDQKNDAKLSAKPSRVENMVFRNGTMQKRFGTSTLSSTIDTGGSFSSGEAIFPYDNELVRLNNSKAYALGSAANKWITKAGTAPILTHTVKTITRKSTNQYDMDAATANGVTAVAWSEGIATHIAVMDETTGTYYQTGATAIATAGSSFSNRCVVLGTKILVFSSDNFEFIYLSIVDTANPATVPTPITLVTEAVNAIVAFDAIAVNSTTAVVGYTFQTGGLNHIKLLEVNSAGTISGSPAPVDKGQTGNAGFNYGVSLHVDGNGVGYVVDYGFTVSYQAFNTSTFATIKARTDITAVSANHKICAIAEATTGSLTVFISGIATGSTVWNTFIGRAVVTSAAITTAYAQVNGTGGLAIQSDGFLVNGVACCAIVNDATVSSAITLQPTAWVMDVNGNTLAKILPGISQAVSTSPRVCRPFTAGSGATAFLVPQQGKTSYTSANGTIIQTTPHGIARVDLTLSSAARVPVLRFGQAVYVGGSMPRIYDGQEIVEAGHNIFPEGLTVAAAAGTVLTAGTYQYRAVYTWINARGEYQRSAPSPAVSVAVSAANLGATLTLPTQRLSGRDIAGISTTQIEVYRTTSNGTLFYRLSSVQSPVLNDTTASTITFNDSTTASPTVTVTDTALQANELLYTTGGINDNIAPPAYTLACNHKTRLMIAGLDNPYEWRSSSKTIDGEMLRFNEAWGGFVPPATGPITALASMDGNFIIFTTQTAYLVLGDGPDLAGNNSWADPQLITSVDAGAATQPACATMLDGIVYQSGRGIELLGRDLSSTYIGADVETYGALNVRAIVQRPELEQLWIHVDDGSDLTTHGTCIVYDYQYKQWSAFPSYGGQSACYYGGKYTRVRSDGAVLQETPGLYLDSGATFASLVETNWLKVAGIQGFQRVWRAFLLGTYNSDFTLTWDAAFDYSGTYAAGNTLTFAGSGVFTAGGPFQLRRHMAQQKCEAVKFRFTESSLTGTGQGMSLTALSLEFGIRSGGVKLPASQSM